MNPNTFADFRPKSDFLRVLFERGFLHQCTDLERLDRRLLTGGLTAYNGFDLTADSLHVGHLIPIMMLRWLQKTGHRPLVLMGGATTRIGDPSFRDNTRPILSSEQIETNLAGIRRSFDRHLQFGDTATSAQIVNNADWLGGLGYLDFLSDVARHFSVNRMLSFDSVKTRLEREQNLSLLEFNYMVLQAYDFLTLSRSHDCVLQLGASDQWGNIINGVELGRRLDGKELFGLTAPLLTTASGAKMGKSAAGAVWLNPNRLSQYEFWQFWRNVDDADVGRFLRLFTEVDLEEIVRLECLQGAELNEAKKCLATEVTTICHGEDAARHALETARQTFETGENSEGLNTVRIAWGQAESGLSVVELLVRTGLVQSKGEARRLIKGKGARINGVLIESETASIGLLDFESHSVRLSAGRKRHALIVID